MPSVAERSRLSRSQEHDWQRILSHWFQPFPTADCRVRRQIRRSIPSARSQHSHHLPAAETHLGRPGANEKTGIPHLLVGLPDAAPRTSRAAGCCAGCFRSGENRSRWGRVCPGRTCPFSRRRRSTRLNVKHLQTRLLVIPLNRFCNKLWAVVTLDVLRNSSRQKQVRQNVPYPIRCNAAVHFQRQALSCVFVGDRKPLQRFSCDRSVVKGVSRISGFVQALPDIR